MIVCCGEALIDFLPRVTSDGAEAFQPFVGGSIFNTAVALGRLGVPAGFLGGLSSDLFGDMLRREMAASHVDFSFSPISNRPSTLAFVKLVEGHARYCFFDEGSADRMLTPEALPQIGPHVKALHFGSFSLIVEPCGSAYEALLAREHEARVINLDPNIRSGFVTDREATLARIARLAAMADILKISDEDAAWIMPDIAIEEAAKAWLAKGAKLVVVTRGARGALAFTRAHRVAIPGLEVKVADTVGAGDTFSAGLLAALHRAGKLTKSAIAELGEADLRAALAVAARAAAITVSRPGADPPWAHELL